MVDRGLRYSMNGVLRSSGTTRWFGRNLRASALGVFSVCIKMLRVPPMARFGSTARRERDGRRTALVRGLELEEEPLRLMCVLSLRAHCDEHRAGLAGRSARDKILGAVEENVAISAPGLLCSAREQLLGEGNMKNRVLRMVSVDR